MGFFDFIFMPVVLFILIYFTLVLMFSYILGKRKTTTPMQSFLLGVVLSFMPPMACLYLIILASKEDVKTDGAG